LRDKAPDRRPIQRLLRRKRSDLAGRAESAPRNFRHAHRIVEAEAADLAGNESVAARLYNEALQDAAASGAPLHAALARELSARGLARRGQECPARPHLEAARAGYERWGALGKVRALAEEHTELEPRRAGAGRAPVTLDLAGVVRTSQALSSEVVS